MDLNNLTKTYTNGEVTVVWKPGLCIHSTVCWKAATGLPEVFDPRKRPWINIEGATTFRIVNQVNKCPSGALSFFYNDPSREEGQGIGDA
ncbi:MAG TPA: (4Fe-4S)-binding protein [Flavisolibacter sp.]|nr:(4Fe-4S)-binding protein [Flavisolibacter sp.]